MQAFISTSYHACHWPEGAKPPEEASGRRVGPVVSCLILGKRQRTLFYHRPFQTSTRLSWSLFRSLFFTDECLLTHFSKMVFNGCPFRWFLGRFAPVNSILVKANSSITQRTGHTMPALDSTPAFGCSSAPLGLFSALARSQWPLLKWFFSCLF